MLASGATPALAQTSAGSGDGTPDLVPVVLWTCVAVIIALLAVSIGYLYRRERGLNTPLSEPPIPTAAALEAHDVSRDAAGHPLPEHVLEHTQVLHDDATEQAKLATAREAQGH
jgi:hypothetical protein